MLSTLPDQKPFLRKKAPFCLTLLVIATTLLSWYNINSLCIMALLLLRLIDGGPRRALKTAFSNKFFLAWFSVFFVELTGLIYTHHFGMAYKHVESKATLAAIPLILCGGVFTDPPGRRKLFSAYCMLIFIACLYCLAMAFWYYDREGRSSVFFYHLLTRPLKMNAVFFSGYVICAILFLLSNRLDFAYLSWLNSRNSRRLQVMLIIFLSGMIVLLASKLLLVLLIIILAAFGAQKFRIRANTNQLIGLAGVLLVIGILILSTKNPVKERYEDIMHGNITLYQKEKFSPETAFNGIQFRLLLWRFAGQILDEQHAWAFGVTAGESQDLLNKKYIAADMSKGFQVYNFHNQFLEVMVRSGLVGLCIFMISCGLMLWLAWETGTREAWFTVIMVLVLYTTQSMLELQHPIFFSCFFPLLLLSGRETGPVQNRAARSARII